MSEQRDLGDDPHEIRLTLPASTSYARVARLAMTGLASRNGFSYDEVEDLRIAVGEIFGILADDDDLDLRVRFTCWLRNDELEIRAARVPHQALGETSELSRQILHGVVDEATIDGPAGRITVTKRQEARP